MAITPFSGPIPDRDDPDFETKMQDLFNWFTGSLVNELNAQVFTNYSDLSWTPVLADAASGGNAATIGMVTGRYVRVGKLVYVEFNLTDIDATLLTPGNNIYIRGLPFTVENVASAFPAAGIADVNFFTFSSVPTIIPSPNAKTFRLRQAVSGGTATFFNVSAITSTGCDIGGRFCYRTSDA